MFDEKKEVIIDGNEYELGLVDQRVFSKLTFKLAPLMTKLQDELGIDELSDVDEAQEVQIELTEKFSEVAYEFLTYILTNATVGQKESPKPKMTREAGILTRKLDPTWIAWNVPAQDAIQLITESMTFQSLTGEQAKNSGGLSSSPDSPSAKKDDAPVVDGKVSAAASSRPAKNV